MKHKRILSLFLLLGLLLAVTGCGENETAIISAPHDADDPVTLSVWVYPMGQWAEQSAVDALLDGFGELCPDVTVEVTCLSAETGDSDVSTAMETGTCPDVLLGTLSRLQHAQRCGGNAVDLSALYHSATYAAVKSACTDSRGAVYALPAVMDVTCMAINYEMFQSAGALQYIDETNHTWTTENFLSAVKALKSADQSPDVLALYCGGQNGDAGTRALVTNLYGGSFTDESRTQYTLDSEENLTALTALQGLRGVIFDKNIVAADENILFDKEQLALSLCWGADRTAPENFTAFPMAYPTADGEPRMPCEVWGFSCFDNGDGQKTEAAKALLTYLTDTDSVYARLVTLCGHYGVRQYNGAVQDDFSAFLPMMGSYDSCTPGFAVARTEWYELLQRLGDGADVALEAETFCTNANAAAQAMK